MEDLDVCGYKIVKWILEKEDWMLWSGFIWLRIRKIGGFR
jgi:hypothetical protein